MNNNNTRFDRRRFLKLMGLGATMAGATLTGCKSAADKIEKTAKANTGEVPTDKMTYRVNHNTGDKVSLLGYGMMRLPQLSPAKAQELGFSLDQEAVNELVDYALAHGVNYFDTSPVYCKGDSEKATGAALSRHPRDSYYLATKLSNFSPASWPREESIKMFE